MYVLVDPTTGTVVQLDHKSYIVEVADEHTPPELEDDFFLDAPDNPMCAVIPVIEHLEFKDED